MGTQILNHFPDLFYIILTSAYINGHFFTGYYLIYAQVYSNSGKADFRIDVNGSGKSRSRGVASGDDDVSANGQLFYKLNAGDIVQLRAKQGFTLFGGLYYSYFQITFLYPE